MANEKNAPKNAAPVNGNVSGVDTAGWEKEQVGFDPYFVIDEGKSFVATLIGRDDGDGTAKSFVRYQFQALEDMVCQRGPNNYKDEAYELCEVKKGETFNISSFYSLAKLLDVYLNYSNDTGKAVTVKVTCKSEKKTSTPGRTVWLWEVMVPPVVKAALGEWRRNHAPKGLKAGNEARQQLES